MPVPNDALLNRTILVAEDEYFLADEIAWLIQQAGGNTQGPYPSAEGAKASLEREATRPDAATLNVNLLDGTSYALADELGGAGVPFVFLSAYDRASLPERFFDAPMLPKPFAAYQVVQALAALLEDDRPTSDRHRVPPRVGH